MELDTNRKLGEVLGSPNAFIDTMLEIQQCVIPRAEFSHWASHLRFIQTPRIDLAELSGFFTGPTVLGLTEKNDNPGETNYLAVSYCWDSFEFANGRDDHPRYNIRTNRGLRPSRTPTRVLDRSIFYAIVHNIRFIWIDQECIEQDNPLDLEQGVQCMDQVYRSAAHSIGLLNTEISSQPLFHTLTHLVSDERHRVARISSWENSWYNHSGNQIRSEMADFLRKLSGDRWFYRNWTYQEASCAQDKMHLLIPVSALVSDFDRCFNEVSVRLSELWSVASMVSAAEKPLRSSQLDHPRPLAMVGLCVQAWNQGRRLSCPQSYEVAGQMRYRDNSVAADRLAITANLCGYTRRLDSAALIARRFSYSVCALALALLNGTIIPSGRTNIFSSIGKPLFRWQEETIYDFLISPEYLSTAYANPDRLESRLAHVRITRQGLETRGWLWKVDRKIALPWVREKHQDFLEKLQNSTNMISLSPQLYVLIKDLLDGFERLNLQRIADTLYDWVRTGQTKTSSSRQSTLDECTTDPYFPGHWLFHLIEKFLQTGHFWCGSLDGEEEISSIFDCEAPATVFTGSDVEFNDIPRPWAAKNFISCEVIPVSESTDSVKELMHTMNSIHGIWHGTEASSKRYLFLWGDM